MKPNKVPRPGAKSFSVSVMPSRESLDKAIDQNGFCEPKKCWHFVAINKLMEDFEPGAMHHVKVDAGHIKLNYRGYRYTADTPKHVKRGLMLFDKQRYDEVYIRGYVLFFRRTTKIVPVSRERQDQINASRAKRISEGGDERRRPYSLRRRVEGFSGIV